MCVLCNSYVTLNVSKLKDTEGEEPTCGYNPNKLS